MQTPSPGLPARRAALRLLDAVLRRGETLAMAEHAALAGVAAEADRALARAIAGEVLRWLADLDALIDSATRQPLPPDAKARNVLRIMLAQWLRLGTPPHAVVATGLPLLVGGPRRLAHGVFGTLVRSADNPAANAGKSSEEKCTTLLPPAPTLPAPVVARWGERAGAIAAGLAVPPPLDLTMRDPATTKDWVATLGGVSLAPGHVRLARGGMVAQLPGFAEGAWWVQDLAASLPARLLGAGDNRRVLDLCAAPGGKTLQLAAAGWQVTALDRSDKRLDSLRNSLQRTGLAAALVAADALIWEPDGAFDAVLLDAPCTSTGTCRRHPDVLHRIFAAQIAEMVALQAQLLERAARWVKPGGQLVYAVCSLEREEGEAQSARVSLSPEPISAAELPADLLPTCEGWLRTDPGMLAEAGGLDGFFAGRWRNL